MVLLSLIKWPLYFFLGSKLNSWENKFSDKHIIRCEKIDTKFNYLWKKIKSSYRKNFILQRDTKWLKWQLDCFLKHNQAWLMLSIKNKKINGYAICIENNNNKDGLKRAFMIDLIYFNQDHRVATNLIGSCIKEAKGRNCDIIEFRGFNKLKRLNINFFNPLEKKIKDNPFYYKLNSNKLSRILNKPHHWIPTYMDGDTIISF